MTFGILELRNRVTQNDVTLRVTNPNSKNKNLHFELNWKAHPNIGPPEYKPTKKDLTLDISPGPTVYSLFYGIIFAILNPTYPGVFLSDPALGGGGRIVHPHLRKSR